MSTFQGSLCIRVEDSGFKEPTMSSARTALFWVITQRVLVIPRRRLGPETSPRNYHCWLRNSPERAHWSFTSRRKHEVTLLKKRVQRTHSASRLEILFAAQKFTRTPLRMRYRGTTSRQGQLWFLGTLSAAL